MGNISNIPIYNPNQTTAAASATSSATSTQDLSQNFLNMLTVQLQNQDPLSPMDNAQMTSQLAALNEVDGINKLNTSVNSLVSQMQAASFMGLSSSVGKKAMVAGSDMTYSGNPIYTSAQLANSTTDLQAVVKDSLGNVVKTVDLGAASAGTSDFIWDGTDNSGNTVANGHYQISFTAPDAQGNSTAPTSDVGVMVASIGQDTSGIHLGLADGRQVNSTDVVKWVAI
jgi:flagellar basal-body rod modification protein FlgD